MKSHRLLIVDDEEDIREVVQMSLELTGGWEVLTAHSGETAIATAAAEQPDVVLLDVMMPGMDGPATFERLRTDPSTSEIPVIFLTAKVQTTEQRQLQDLGAAGLISKPFDPLLLNDQVCAILDPAG
jgi:CheY-like chemotaxis protein